ncbi:hypothetical protein AGLY_010208, partial [Aphis glycines]
MNRTTRCRWNIILHWRRIIHAVSKDVTVRNFLYELIISCIGYTKSQWNLNNYLVYLIANVIFGLQLKSIVINYVLYQNTNKYYEIYKKPEKYLCLRSILTVIVDCKLLDCNHLSVTVASLCLRVSNTCTDLPVFLQFAQFKLKLNLKDYTNTIMLIKKLITHEQQCQFIH